MDFEKAVLHKLRTVDGMRQCWDLGLRLDVFEDLLNSQVYEFTVRYWLENAMAAVPTAGILEHEFPAFRPLETDPEESIPWLVEALQKRYEAGEVQELIREAAGAVNDDPRKVAEMLYYRSWAIKQAVAPRHDRTDLAETTEQRRMRYLDRVAPVGRPGAVPGVTIGLPEVDEHTGGILPGELAIACGYAKTGKSMTLCNAAVAARRQGFTPLVYTLEQSVSEFEDRLDAFASGVGYGRLQRGHLNDEELEDLQRAREELAALGPLYVEKPARGERTVQDLVGRCRQLGADFLIIDQLSFMEARPGKWKKDTREAHSEIVFELKDEINRSGGMLPCLMAVQFNRESVATKGERGTLRNIANSSVIEQTVDIAFGLYRDREMRANKSMVLDILGSRRSDVESWLLAWHLEQRTEISVRETWVD